MARKRKELPVVENVEITGVAAEGNSFARINDLVTFIPFGAPGDIANIKIDKKKKNYAEGHIETLIKPSPIRVEPFCEHFTVCGGCRWQHLPYQTQLDCKRQQVVDAFDRIAKVQHPEVKHTLRSQQTVAYRNKLEFTFSNKSWLTFEQMRSGAEFPDRDAAGFHIPGAFDKVLDINKCHLQDDIANRLRLFIKDFGKKNGFSFYDIRAQKGFLRTLIVRTTTTGEIMVIMVLGAVEPENRQMLMNAIAENFPEITSLLYVENLKVNDTIGDQEVVTFRGKDFIVEMMEDLKFRVGPKSFYQTNSRQAEKLYGVVRDFAALTGNELIYDLYTGTGTIANFLARNAAKVIGIEYVPEAIDDAKINSSINGIDNTLFYAGDMKDILTDQFIKEHGRPDVMVIDPPRAGMHENVVNVILRARPQNIVYVSCNPASQARDLALMNDLYEVIEVQPVDMFPHTHHVENVAKLRLREEPLHSSGGSSEAEPSEEL